MKFVNQLIMLVLLSSCFTLKAQEETLLEDLAFYGDVMVNVSQAKHREMAKEQFEIKLKTYVGSESYDEDNFEVFDGCARVESSQDSLLTILSWQVILNDEHHYGAYLFYKDFEPILLVDQGTIDRNNEFDILDKDNWYGALYYNIKDYIDDKGQTKYFIFGFNGLDKYDSYKLMDVLYFDEGEPVFGAPIFIKNPDSDRPEELARIKLKYSSEVKVSINYNENAKMVMYDHLISRMGQMEGQGVTSVPDGSYEGFLVENGQLVYKEKLFDHVYEKAPVSKENQEKSKRNIFGDQKKK